MTHSCGLSLETVEEGSARNYLKVRRCEKYERDFAEGQSLVNNVTGGII